MHLSVHMLLAYTYTCHSPILTHVIILCADTQTPHAKNHEMHLGSGAGRSRAEGRRRIAVRGAASRAGAGQGCGAPVGPASLPLTPSYLRPRGWRCRRWCAPPAGAWQTPGRNAPAPAPAPSPWPARAGGDGRMMKRRRRRKVRRSTAYSRLPGAPSLTGPSCSSSAKGCQSLRARLGGR